MIFKIIVKDYISDQLDRGMEDWLVLDEEIDAKGAYCRDSEVTYCFVPSCVRSSYYLDELSGFEFLLTAFHIIEEFIEMAEINLSEFNIRLSWEKEGFEELPDACPK